MQVCLYKERHLKSYEIWNEDILTINGIDTLNISEEEKSLAMEFDYEYFDVGGIFLKLQQAQ